MNVVDLFPEARVNPGADVDRRYTTRETMDLCKRLAGVDAWDLDAAADEESHWAPCWYSAQQDGLALRWIQRTWVNPPYSNIEPWVAKAWREICHCRVIAMLLPANRTEQSWWQKLVEPFRDSPRLTLKPASSHDMDDALSQASTTTSLISFRTHYLPGRIRFGHPGNRDAVGVGSPPFGCVLLVWRSFS